MPLKNIFLTGWWWWHTPLTLALGRQRQVEFEVTLFYKASSRIARTTQRNPISKNQN